MLSAVNILKKLWLPLVAMALILVVVAAFATALEPAPTGAQSGSPTPAATAPATPTVPAADAIRVSQPRLGQGEVVVYWKPSDSPAVARVGYANLSQWLREATDASLWGDAIQWTPAQQVGTATGSCNGGQCPDDSTHISELTLGDTYIFTVVKSAGGANGQVWPAPVWHSFIPAEAQPTLTPTPASNICNGPFAALLPQCGGSLPTPTPMPTGTRAPTVAPTPASGNTDPCDGPFAALIPQCN